MPNLKRHHASCGLNYSLLSRLALRFGSEHSIQFVLPFGGQDCVVKMRFTDLGPYTGLCESQCSVLRGGCAWVPLPAFTVRLYLEPLQSNDHGRVIYPASLQCFHG